ncbi:sigma-70 family RNA polymerase sigma factor [Ruminococcus sp.]|uniref:sigma-70 family RNA polymerase sigma factor n=1 Tax=Ruminococcus sp. TaxID=41978 RepID=UPI0026146F08|nr:sigma-70 family RNA polymerase sigma factor [Ruminococcus sp.]MDD6988340.1 sigma-70 family RNA polymerase sigma factor [Ruminococcus sp.]MDY6201976.1 sigma-70 family RNA polymerase sigma factor [Ruminococcus sp.]
MKTKIIHFTNENTSKILFSSFNPNGTTNSESRRRMKEIISKAIVTELTDMQRICLTEHYLNDKKQKEIASELGLNASTVSRHISSARRKLQNIASYYAS